MLMMSQGMPNGLLPGMKNEVGFPASEGAGAEFVNLLDLVEGMEVAEMSSASDKELNFAKLGETLKDDSGEKVALDKDAALAGLALSGIEMNAGLIGKTVGQEIPAQAVALGTAHEVASEVALPQDLLVNTPVAPQLNKPEARLDSESVAAWTTAFAAGEIKDVEVSKTGPEGMDLAPRRHVASMERALMAPLAEPVVDHVQNVVASPEKITPLEAKKPEEGFVSLAATVERVKSNDASVASFAQRDFGQGNDKSSDEPSKKNASLQAKDLFLDRSDVSSGQFAPRAASVLTTSIATKGSPVVSGDQNVVDFVADKVQTLSSAGGGSLRVGLDTKDMGQIEIKVTLRAGRVDVRISGDSPELTRQLESHRSELTSKLEQHVQLGDLEVSRTPAARIEDSKQVLASAGSMRLTEDLMKNVSRDGVESASRSVEQIRNERLESLRASAPTGRSEESASADRGFSRDERRGQALNQWATFSQMRESA